MTGELRLRPLTEADREDFLYAESDEETAALTGRKVEPEELFRICLEDCRCYAMDLNGVYAGQVTFHKSSLTDVPGGAEAWELSYSVAPECRGMGFGTRAMELALETGKNELKGDVLLAGAFSDNVPSRRLLERAGFRPVFERPDGEKTETIYLRVLN